LATFIAFPEKIGGIDVMAQPYHDLIGLVCLTLAALPLVCLSGRRVVTIKLIPPNPPFSKGGKTSPFEKGGELARGRWGIYIRHFTALGFVILAAVIISLPRQPLDVSDTRTALSLPVYLNGEYAQTVELSEKEQNYFTQYGGTALKRRYGDSSVLLIRSNSPLRHIHTPDDCLRGLGFEVQYQGVYFQPLPTAVYLATAKDGSQWRVAVSFYSEQGQFTTNVSEVVWRWLQQPHSTWYALQRITPLYIPESKAKAWDNALFAALDLTYQESSHVKSH
jgi:hypothetical protein